VSAGIGPKLPLSVGSDDASYTLTKTIGENTAQNLKHLVLTCPGEKMMDPKFGVGVRNFLFNQFSEDTKSSLSRRILKQVQKYMSYVRIDNIEFSNTSGVEDPTIKLNYLSLRISYTIKPLSLSSVIDINESLD